MIPSQKDIIHFTKCAQDGFNKNQKTTIYKVCAPCGISANVLTCLKKYGKRPDKLCFDCSTTHIATCDVCGNEDHVTEKRDFFYPDFSLLTSKRILNAKQKYFNSLKK